MSAFSAYCLCYPATTIGIGTSSLRSQEKATIFRRSKFSNFNTEPLQECQQKTRNTRRRKYCEVRRIYSSKERDESEDLISKLDGFKYFLRALYEFSRPYTVLGSITCIASVSVLPLNSWTQVTPHFLVELLKAIIPFLFVNVYVVGINQIYDVEIDKVNKPSLPLASGELSMVLGVKIVAVSLIMALGLGIRFGSPVLLGVLVSWALLGTMYSVELPYMRWKKNPFLAAFCIAFSRSISLQFAYYIHVQKYVLGEPIVVTRGIIFAASFMFLFTSVISFFKDIPDIDGDRLFNIETFGVKFGQNRMFWLCGSILMMAYGGAMAYGIYSSSLFNKIVTVSGHFSLAFILMNKALRINEINKESTQAFYMLIWKLFYAEYLLIPFMR